MWETLSNYLKADEKKGREKANHLDPSIYSSLPGHLVRVRLICGGDKSVDWGGDFLRVLSQRFDYEGAQ